VLGVLLAAFLVARGCGATETQVSTEEAIEIAREQLDFVPECVQVRFFRRGVNSRAFYAVSLWTVDARGAFGDIALVVVEARSGAVAQVDRDPNTARPPARCQSPV
jgi:hypothetical protein